MTTFPEQGKVVASLLTLPVEIRLDIYSYLFDVAKVVLDAGNPGGRSCLIPAAACTSRRQPRRSSQLLRVCKTVLYEARPILYANTTFHVMTQTFAGSLPSSFSNGHPIARHARNLVWQLESDVLKRYYPEDFAFQEGELGMLHSVEVRAKIDTWKGSFCGEDCDQEGFLRGRHGMLEYGKLLLAQMQSDGHGSAQMVEDQRFLGKGEARFFLRRHIEKLGPGEVFVKQNKAVNEIRS